MSPSDRVVIHLWLGWTEATLVARPVILTIFRYNVAD